MNGHANLSTGSARQAGAALIIGLVLLLVLTILAVSGVVTTTLQLRMVGNQQHQERAFQAAEVGIEDALTEPQLSTTVPEIGSPTAVPGSTDDEYEYRIEYAGETAIGPGLTGYSVGTGFTSYHFTVEATGRSTGGAESRHVQGLYIVGPGGP